ncbi:nucleotidyltransferase domain-containing protein [Oceanispirochaeta sp. M1]|nr:nucleotidyltransferase domain-containing protein [Oceanispirochaeta sp. M1]
MSLFGSRSDDNARGGDIDLFIRTDLTGIELQEARIRTMAGISLRIGEQKIDIVCYSGKEKEKSLIILEALRTSIPL